MINLVRFGVLLLLLGSAFTQAASFNCDRAQSYSEKEICKSPVLSSLDEQYATLYKSSRAESIDNEAQFHELKFDAVTALRWREANCKNQFCLLEWYEHRIEKLTHGDVGPEQPELTLSALFRTLNMRTLANTLNDDFDKHCKTYPADFFPSASIQELTSDTIVLEHENISWYFKIKDNNAISVGEKLPGMDFYMGRPAKLAYKSDHAEWHGNWLEPQWPDWCMRVDVNWPTMSKARTLHMNSWANDSNNHTNNIQSASIGEIQFSGMEANRKDTPASTSTLPGSALPYYVDTTPIYAKPGEKEIGKLVIALKLAITHDTAAAIQILLYDETTPLIPPVNYRRKTDPALLLYDRMGTWVNISSKINESYWIDLSTMPALQTAFVTRDHVIQNASEIAVRSAHNLRASPSTDSTILAVLGRTSNESIFPLEIQGDWLKVHYVHPGFDQLYSPDVLKSLHAEYTQLSGWIKFRDSNGRELIKVRYYYD